jgi:hypothetical protein
MAKYRYLARVLHITICKEQKILGKGFIMNNTVNNQTNGVEYSELYRNLRKEVFEQSAKTTRLPEDSYSNSDKRANDKAEFNKNAPAIASQPEKLNEDDAKITFSSLIGAIKHDPASAYEAQNNLLASRIATLLES